MNSLPQRSRTAIDAAALLLLSVLALFATVSATAFPRDPSRGVALIFAPWTTPEAVLTRVAATGGRFVRFGGVSFVAIAIPHDADYAARAFASGAWLIVDPLVISACAAVLPFKVPAT